jgi:hypothetical protein
MQITRAGWAALAAAVGLWLCFPASGQALTVNGRPAAKTAAEKPLVLTKFSKREQAKKSTRARQVSTQTARKAPVKQQASRHAVKSGNRHAAAKSRQRITANSATRPAARTTAPADATRTAMPPSVANARAEALAKDQEQNIAALDDTDVSVMDGVEIAASDQLNDVDRSVTEADAASSVITSTPSTAAVAPPPAPAPGIVRAKPAADAPVATAESGDTWNRTSLIGKIFVAFGSLLTLASAARMMFA